MLVNATDFQKVKKYTPILTDNYRFPVKEVPMFGHNRGLEGAGVDHVEALDCKGIMRTDTNQIISVVGQKYKLIPHAEVIDSVQEEIKKSYEYDRLIYTTHDGARIYAEYTIKNMSIDIVDGDPVGLKLIVRNSYDGSTIMGILLEGMRMLCLNGLMGIGSLFDFGKKHMGEIIIADNISQKLSTAVSTYKDSLIPYWKNLSQKSLSKEQGIAIIMDTSMKKVIPEKYEEEVMTQWETKANDFNAWILYNCYTFALTHIVKKISYENYINSSKKVSAYFRQQFN